MVMDLNRLYNTYLASRKHLGAAGGHYSPIHNLNSNILEFSQNGQTDQMNSDCMHDVIATRDARLGAQMHVNGLR